MYNPIINLWAAVGYATLLGIIIGCYIIKARKKSCNDYKEKRRNSESGIDKIESIRDDMKGIPYSMWPAFLRQKANKDRGEVLCHKCDGTGSYILTEYGSCDKCNGSGVSPDIGETRLYYERILEMMRTFEEK